MRVILYSYNRASGSTRELQQALVDKGIRTLRVLGDSDRFRPRPDDLVINWGNSQPPTRWEAPMLNNPRFVARATNKASFFNALVNARLIGVHLPDFTNDPIQVRSWLEAGSTVFARTILNGHSGQGIVVLDSPDSNIPSASLYTRYKKKRNEYRVHVFNGEAIDLQEKKRATAVPLEERTTQQALIRSHANGWNFCRDNLDITEENRSIIYSIAERVSNTIGLDFGAVDIIYNQKENKFYVLEVNTAPALSGQTLTNYATAIETFIQQL